VISAPLPLSFSAKSGEGAFVAVAEVSFELEVGKIPVSFQRAFVVKRAGGIRPGGAVASGEEVGFVVVEFVHLAVATSPWGVL